jgi:hypothetical protein
MFGSLIGHLGLARKNLEKDVIISKQNIVATSVLQKNSEESKRLNDLRQSTLKKKMANEKKIELDKLTALWRNNLEKLKNFICTEASPKICWLPAHHNDATRSLLEKRSRDIEELIVERLRNDTKVVNDLLGISSNQHDNLESLDIAVSVEDNREEEKSRFDDEHDEIEQPGDMDGDNSNNSSPNKDLETSDKEEIVDERPSEADLW